MAYFPPQGHYSCLRYDYISQSAIYSELSKAFGHPHVSVLNGGLLAWTAAGGELDTVTPAEVEQPSSAYPIPPLNPEVLRSERFPTSVSLGAREANLLMSLGYAQMFDNSGRSEGAAELVLDARSEGR